MTHLFYILFFTHQLNKLERSSKSIYLLLSVYEYEDLEKKTFFENRSRRKKYKGPTIGILYYDPQIQKLPFGIIL